MRFTRFALSPGAARVAAQEEKNMIKKILLGLIVAAFAFAGGTFSGSVFSGSALAQGIKRTPLQKIDFPEGYTTVTAIAEIPAGGASGRHSHPGIETGYVLDGELELAFDGKPSLKVKAGESYQIPAGEIHDAKASGDKPLKVLAIYIVDKTKPLATPAP
jgi:quercetin dioxygenase-like cupin family protein